MRRVLLIVGAFVLVTTAYLLWPERESAVPIPYGPYQAEGVLTQTGVSLARRGTHVFTATDGTRFLAESSAVNLRELVGSRIGVTGTTSPNLSAKYLPLLTITAAEVVDQAAAQKPVSSIVLGLSIAVPSLWTTHEAAGVLTAMSGTSAVLTIKTQDPKETLPAGTLVRIGGRNGVRRALADGSVQITIPLTDRWIVFAALRANKDIESVLQSVRFLTDVRSSQSSMSQTSSVAADSATGSVSGGGTIFAVCGGAAGLLCPPGQYCSIQDFATSTGVCRTR